MKNAKVENRKIAKAAIPRRVSGVPVRSGVKAGLEFRGPKGPEAGGIHEFGGVGGPGPPGGLF
jgi:hypothetical protein